MPIYDFECTDCSIIEEKMQKYSDAPPVCPNCGKEMKRKVSASHLRIPGVKGYHKDTGDWSS